MYSNKAPIALDVSSNVAISAANNYGMNNYSMVTITQGYAYHSTASCATQVYDDHNQGKLNERYYCDNWDQFISPLSGETLKLTLSDTKMVTAYLNENNIAYSTTNRIIGNTNLTESQVLALIESNELTQDQVAKTWYNFYSQTKDYTKALENLNNLNDNNADNYSFKQVHSLNLKMLCGVELTAEELEILTALIDPSNEASDLFNLAVSVSKATANSGQYKTEFPTVKNITVDPLQVKTVTKGLIELDVFPNPFSDNISVQIRNGKTSESQEVVVHDLSGREVFRQNVGFVSGQIILDLDHLTEGTYILMLIADQEISAQQKIVKY